MFRSFLVSLMLVFSTAAIAEWKPTKTVEVLVPFPPGSGNDIIVRPLIDKIEKNTGVKFTVVNKPGAGGTVGSTLFTKKENDDHAISVIAVGGIAAMDKTFPAFRNQPPYTLDSFEYVTAVGTTPVVVIANKNDSVSTPKELFNVINNEKVVVADSGGAGRLGLESFLIHSGARTNNKQIIRVEHKGPAETVVDIMGGHVRFGTVPLAVAYPHYKAGNLKIIAATQQTPFKQLNIASMSEVNTKIEAGIVWGIVMPKGVSKEAVDWFAKEFNKALNDSDIAEFYSKSMFFKPADSLLVPSSFKQYVYNQEKTHSEVVNFIVNSTKQ